jgi:hypothetical protein
MAADPLAGGSQLTDLLDLGERELGESLAQLASGSGSSSAPHRAAASRLGEVLARRPQGVAGLDPLVWLVYYRLGQAILDHAPLPSPWGESLDRLDHLAGRCLAAGQVIAWGDSSLYNAAEWEAILKLLQEGGDFVADLTPPSAATQSALVEATATVLGLGRPLQAGLGPSIERLLQLTILAVPGPRAQAARQSFGGATAFFLRGASVIHASPVLTLPGLLERLVHEAAHAELFVLAQDSPLCHNPDDERYPVQIRPDPRPMNGILHSLHVTGRVCETLDALLASGFSGHPEPALLLEDCQQLREQQAELGRSSLAAARRHGRLTELGQAVCEAGARRLAAAGAEGARAEGAP